MLRLCNLMIDCAGSETTLERAGTFWSEFLRVPVTDPNEHGQGRYVVLGVLPGPIGVEIQLGESLPGVHLDFEVDDLDEEVRRAVMLGAEEVERKPPPKDWVVMRAPTGHGFCLFRRQR